MKHHVIQKPTDVLQKGRRLFQRFELRPEGPAKFVQGRIAVFQHAKVCPNLGGAAPGKINRDASSCHDVNILQSFYSKMKWSAGPPARPSDILRQECR